MIFSGGPKIKKVLLEHCGVKEGVVTKNENSMLRWFGYDEGMSERSRLTKGIYKVDVGGNTGRERLRRTYQDG